MISSSAHGAKKRSYTVVPVSYPMSKIRSIDYVASSPALPIVPLSVNRSESANSGHFLFQTDILTNPNATRYTLEIVSDLDMLWEPLK